MVEHGLSGSDINHALAYYKSSHLKYWKEYHNPKPSPSRCSGRHLQHQYSEERTGQSLRLRPVWSIYPVLVPYNETVSKNKTNKKSTPTSCSLNLSVTPKHRQHLCLTYVVTYNKLVFLFCLGLVCWLVFMYHVF